MLTYLFQNFYIGTRRALTHQCCDKRCVTRWFDPTTIAEWMKLPSAKLCALCAIVVHHLQTDNAQPLHCVDGHDLAVNPNAPITERPADLPKDRIVIYSAFPSSSNVIINVGPFFNVNALS